MYRRKKWEDGCTMYTGEKRVEEAIKKIKHGVGAEWSQFTREDIDLLGHLLQCTWNVIDQKIWDNIPFARMTKNRSRRSFPTVRGLDRGKTRNLLLLPR